MAGFDPEQFFRRDKDGLWMKVTPGRIDTFLTHYIDRGDMSGRNLGTAERFLAQLEMAAGRVPTNRKLLTTCDVYVISAANAVKIGIAADPLDRVARLQTGADGKLALAKSWRLPRRRDAFDVEREAHYQLRGQRLRNEWFAVTPEEAIACVEAIVAARG